MNWQAFSSRSRHHPFAGGFPNPHTQPRPAGFASAPGVNRFVETAGSCVANATPVASTALQIDSGTWTACGVYCGYNVNVNGAGLYKVVSVDDDILVIDSPIFTSIGVSAVYTIDTIVQDFAFPADPGFDFLALSTLFEVIDANTIELQSGIFLYRGLDAWPVAGVDDGDVLTIEGSATSDGHYLVQIDPTDLARVIVPGGHGLANGIDTASRILRWHRRCDITEFIFRRQLIMYDWAFTNENIHNLWQDVGATIPVAVANDPIRAVTNIGSATGSPILIRDAASTGEIRWNPQGLNGYGSAIFDGTAWFTLAAPQEGFVDLAMQIVLLAKSDKAIRNSALINNIMSWDIVNDGLQVAIENTAAPDYSALHRIMGGRDGGLFGSGATPLIEGVWYGYGLTVQNSPAGNTQINTGITDTGSTGELSGVPPAPVLPATATEDFFLGRIEGDAASDRFVGEISRVIIWDNDFNGVVMDVIYDTLEPEIGTRLPLNYLPDWTLMRAHAQFSDPLGLYTDVGATTLVASDGDAIAAVATKGNGKTLTAPNLALFTQSTLANRPIYKTNGPRGKSYASFNGSVAHLSSSSFITINADPFGMILGVIFRRQSSVPVANDSIIFSIAATHNIKINMGTGEVTSDVGAGDLTLLESTDLGNWYLAYICADGGGNVDDALWGSPGPEDNTAQGLPVDAASLATYRIGDSVNAGIIDILDFFIYSSDKPADTRARIREYALRAYGFLPHI